MPSEHRLAAVDLGSNSFRLEIGQIDHGVFRRTEYIKETVRQGAGLDESRNLTPAAMRAGWDCLARFGERLAGFQPTEVRAVATQTLREARNRDEFLHQANQILGFPIDVVSGREEARLIYQGVSQLLPASAERRLVVDIGGRSTELILGQGRTPGTMESFRVGSIAWARRFFGDGQLDARAFEMAEVAATAVLDEAFDAFDPQQWDAAYGSAGTIGAVADALAAAGWPAGSISREGLDWLRLRLEEAGHIDQLRLAGLREDRKPIIGGGLSILRALFSLLRIPAMEVASGGLRHGLVCDLMGRHDEAGALQVSSVERLVRKFAVDSVHGQRVGDVACRLYRQLTGLGEGAAAPDDEAALRTLHWAAELHEIGCRISHSDYHKHGAYILDNADAVGFALSDLHRLSLLVLGHRGKLRKLGEALDDAGLVCQLACLRLAIILCHARRDPDLQGISLQPLVPGQRQMRLQCRTGWAARFPQSAHLLREEVLAWEKTPWKLLPGGL